MHGLNTSATVYTPSVSTGEYTVSAKTGLVCRLAHIQTAAASLDHERANIGSSRRLLWDETYTMPDDAQIEIDSERWNVRAGTFSAITGPDLVTVVYYRCEVTKAI